MTSNDKTTRRDFLRQTGLAGAGILGGILPTQGAESPNDKIVAGVMGTNGRGMAHISSLLSLPNVEIAYVCDVDRRAVEKAVQAVAKKQGKAPKGVGDFRRILEDGEVDVLTIAAPNHWHAPATILACAAGKHVYVEKPGSHNAQEAEWIVAAARKHNRKVQMGNQRRSWRWVKEAMARLHAGEIGKVVFARTWYNNRRGSIGQGKQTSPPDWLNYALWQGPAPSRPYKDNLIHYNWHWHWHWGGGELANNGIHALDLARWGLGAEYPVQVTSLGRRYHFNDDQETPDIYVTSFDFGHCGATWESHSCDPHGFEGTGFGVTFYGQKGTMVIAGNDCQILDLNDKPVAQIKSPGSDNDHFANFLAAIRSGEALNSDIAECQKSTMLCHLGNIAQRAGKVLKTDASNGRISEDSDAKKFWGRDYEPAWTPKV